MWSVSRVGTQASYGNSGHSAVRRAAPAAITLSIVVSSQRKVPAKAAGTWGKEGALLDQREGDRTNAVAITSPRRGIAVDAGSLSGRSSRAPAIAPTIPPSTTPASTPQTRKTTGSIPPLNV